MYLPGHNNILIILSGPTGVGKTSVSIALANHFQSDIFSADSRQVYKELSIGTAKPSAYEMNGINHHFINHISIHDKYDVGKYEKEVIEAFDDYYLNNNTGILTGGTGLYISAVTNGLNDFPDPPWRRNFRA